MQLYDASGRLILRIEQEDESKLVHTPKQATAENLRHLPYGSDYVGPTYYPLKVDDQGRIYVVTDTNADIETDASPTLGGDLDANGKKISALLSLDFSDFAEVTLDTDGEITVTQSCHTVDTFEDAVSDDLVTINGGTNGMVIILRAENDGRTVVVKHNTGNIWLKGGADLSLDDVQDCLMLVYDGTKWMDVGAGGGGGAGDMTKAVYDTNDNGVVDAVDGISGHLENPPTEDLGTKAPTSEWAFDHNARNATAAVQGHATAAQITKLDGIAALADVTGDNAPQAHTHTIIQDDDDDTKIQVEESADEDCVRMDVAGVEAFRLSDVGILTLAKQARCHAYLSSVDMTIPTATWARVMLDGEDSDTQNEFDSTLKTGTADATEANKLHDADGGFSAADVGAYVWNTTDNTYTTVSAFVDSGELTLTDDIMVNGEGYRLYRSTYTVTEDGSYLLMASLLWLTCTANKRYILQFMKNGVQFGNVQDHSGVATHMTNNAVILADLEAGDEVSIAAYQDSGVDGTLDAGIAKTTLAVVKVA